MEPVIIDLRSDTVTKPTPEMRRAMAEAEVGDDVYGEDPSVNRLEEEVARMFGKEAALFVVSGTMANLISVLTHCQARGSEIYMAECCHIFMYEQGGAAHLAGVQPFPLRTLPDGTFRVEDLEVAISHRDPGDFHYPRSALVCLENTNVYMGGAAVPLHFMKQVQAVARKHGLPVHLDGARLMNAAAALGVQPRDITCYCDSVSMCFSKGIGAPVGAVIAGSKDFIERARRTRKMLGGGWRQAGVLAAPALIGLRDAAKNAQRDNDNAALICKVLREKGKGLLEVVGEGVCTNMVLMKMLHPDLHANDLQQQLRGTSEEEEQQTGRRVQVMTAYRDTRFRLVLHCNISDQDLQALVAKLEWVLDGLRRRLCTS